MEILHRADKLDRSALRCCPSLWGNELCGLQTTLCAVINSEQQSVLAFPHKYLDMQESWTRPRTWFGCLFPHVSSLSSGVCWCVGLGPVAVLCQQAVPGDRRSAGCQRSKEHREHPAQLWQSLVPCGKPKVCTCALAATCTLGIKFSYRVSLWTLLKTLILP